MQITQLVFVPLTSSCSDSEEEPEEKSELEEEEEDEECLNKHNKSMNLLDLKPQRPD